MVIKKFNVSKPEQYQKGNETKTMWHNIGIITEFHKDDGSIGRIIEIPAIGLKANIFPQEKREQKEGYFGRKPSVEKIPKINVDENISAEDLPF